MKPIKEDQHIRFEGGDRFKEYCKITKDGYNKFYWAKKFYLELKNKEL